jgi:hypothetical protein
LPARDWEDPWVVRGEVGGAGLVEVEAVSYKGVEQDTGLDLQWNRIAR